MHIHILRVQETKSQRQWWIKSDNAEDDLMKFHSKASMQKAVRGFELIHNCKVTKIYKYKGGVNSPAEAAMAVADIMQRHEKEAEA